MASTRLLLQLFLLAIFIAVFLILVNNIPATTYQPSISKNTSPITTCYRSIFSFGDSLADTGNFLHYSGNNSGPVGQLPYGKTYFHRATGRFSDGRLIIDFIAQAMGLPLVPPYLAGKNSQDFRHGANFAVAGATALDNDFFRAKGLKVAWPEYSLGTQIKWFRQLLPSLCSSDSGKPSSLLPHRYLPRKRRKHHTRGRHQIVDIYSIILMPWWGILQIL